jgi:hypothetical protein
MNGRFFIPRGVIAVVLLMVLTFVLPYGATAQTGGEEKTFAKYRQAIKKEFGIDIKNFKDALKGGRADGQIITKYDLKQLLMGIKVELEHTTNRMLALEIATDHLEEFPDYYTRLEKMEEEAEKSHRPK